MYLDYFALKHFPFEPVTQRNLEFFPAAGREHLLNELLYTLENRDGDGAVLISGDEGVGKTVLAHALMARLESSARVGLITGQTLDGQRPFAKVAVAMGVQESMTGSEETAQQCLLNLVEEEVKHNRFSVLIIDALEEISPQALQKLYPITGWEYEFRKILPMVWLGNSRVKQLFSAEHLGVMASRVTQGFSILALNRQECESYLGFRLQKAGFQGAGLFSASAVRALHLLSQGRIKRLDILAHRALEAAYVDGERWVRGKHVLRGVSWEDIDFGARIKRAFFPGSSGVRHSSSGVLRHERRALEDDKSFPDNKEESVHNILPGGAIATSARFRRFPKPLVLLSALSVTAVMGAWQSSSDHGIWPTYAMMQRWASKAVFSWGDSEKEVKERAPEKRVGEYGYQENYDPQNVRFNYQGQIKVKPVVVEEKPPQPIESPDVIASYSGQEAVHTQASSHEEARKQVTATETVISQESAFQPVIAVSEQTTSAPEVFAPSKEKVQLLIPLEAQRGAESGNRSFLYVPTSVPEWLAGSHDRYITIEIPGLENEQELRDLVEALRFMGEGQGSDRLFVLQRRAQRVGVFYSRYQRYSEAIIAFDTLPEVIQKRGPVLRIMGDIHREISTEAAPEGLFFQPEGLDDPGEMTNKHAAFSVQKQTHS
ncbi:AAA family ATPase [Magnetococcales bacterium HHB-1]